MVFRCHNNAGLFRPAADERFVERLYRDRINDSSTDPRPLQLLGRLQRLMHHNAACDDHCIAARAEHCAFADLEVIVRRIDGIGLLTADAQIFHAPDRLELPQERDNHGNIRNVNDNGIRNSTVKRHILKRHMRAAVERGCDAGVRADHRDGVFGVTAGKEDLVKAAAGRKRAKGMRDRMHTDSG